MTEHQIDQSHIDAAATEEQTLMQNFLQQQQAQYLLNRCITLNAEARQTVDGSVPQSDEVGAE